MPQRKVRKKVASVLSPAIAADAFAALGSEQRLELLRVLARAGSDGLTTGELGERADVHGSTLSHHLKCLTDAGLVQQAKQGRFIFCSANAYTLVQDLSDYLLGNCCAI